MVTKDDFEKVVELMSEFAEESLSEYGTKLDIDQLKKTFDSGCDTSFAAIVDDKMVGVLGGRIVNDFCSAEPVYEEIVWFMNKKYRRYGIKLFNFMQQWCVVHGVNRITMCAMENSMRDKLGRLYERLGFQVMETRYIKVIN